MGKSTCGIQPGTRDKPQGHMASGAGKPWPLWALRTRDELGLMLSGWRWTKSPVTLVKHESPSPLQNVHFTQFPGDSRKAYWSLYLSCPHPTSLPRASPHLSGFLSFLHKPHPVHQQTPFLLLCSVSRSHHFPHFPCHLPWFKWPRLKQ